MLKTERNGGGLDQAILPYQRRGHRDSCPRSSPIFTSEDDIGNCHPELIDAILRRDTDSVLEILRRGIHYDDE